MASQALAGYYPYPPALIPALAALIAPAHGTHIDAFLDPCAGKGEALFDMLAALYPKAERKRVKVYAAELEKTRHAELEENSRLFRAGTPTPWDAHKLLHCDALRAHFVPATGEKNSPTGATVLYLNPPYDTDNRFKRTEERFLRRFLHALMPRGVLLYVVPVHALAASADTIATHFEHVAVHRFPDGEFDAYKQVVLVGRRVSLARRAMHEGIRELVLAAAREPLAMPVLGDAVKPLKLHALPSKPRYEWQPGETLPGEASLTWEARVLDEPALVELHAPWAVSDRFGKTARIPAVFPAQALGALSKRFKMAVPPKPAHIAQGVAAGLFNGETLIADDRASDAPPLIVKGRFAREWTTVREKHNDKGELVSTEQVEEPRLEVTALDLRALTYTTFAPSPEPTGSTSPTAMTTGDLLTQYGESLLYSLRSHCPVTHDPADPAHVIPLVQTARPLYSAQAHAAMAMVKLLGGPRASRRARRGTFCALIGEVGCGKTGTFLVAARSIDARRTLVLCPPHLVDSWRDEAALVWPEARFVLIDSVHVVDLLLAEAAAEKAHPGTPKGKPIVAVLTRETAKLGHAYRSVGRCGRCGTKPRPYVDHAMRRSRCEGFLTVDMTSSAQLFVDLRDRLIGCISELPGKPRMLACGELSARDRALHASALRCLEDPTPTRADAAYHFALAFAADSLRIDVAEKLCALAYSPTQLRILAMCVHPEAPGFDALCARFGESDAVLVRAHSAYLHAETDEAAAASDRRPAHPYIYGVQRGHNDDDIQVENAELGSDGHAVCALNYLDRPKYAPCGEPIYEAVPEPRRYPLAQYIQRRAPDLFDILGLDEAHELAGDGTAQERAAHRLTGLGMPTALLTGSLVNGYAEHLFAHLWALSPEFRKRFPRDGKTAFAKAYGYRKRAIVEKPTESKGRGAVTDRVEGGIRDLGSAPGVQPLAVLEWLLPFAVTLHKAELGLDLPQLTAKRVLVKPTPAQARIHAAMLAALLAQIKRDRFSKLSGALWGQMSEAPSHLDRMTADIGNSEGGEWLVQYPEQHGGAVVHAAPSLPAETILPKEQAMLAAVVEELADNRPVIVLAWHTQLLTRYARLIREKTGEQVAILHADKVTPAKRQAWIAKQTAAGIRVLVTNPVAIQTGLNVLTFYATQLWMQNPGCNAIVYRQAVGRIDRIGQKLAPKVLFFVYEDTIQAPLHSLLLSKVAVSQATDGLDARSALQAAGVGETAALTALSVGKILFDLLDGEKGARLHKALRLSQATA